MRAWLGNGFHLPAFSGIELVSLRIEVAAELMVGCNVSIPVKRILNQASCRRNSKAGRERNMCRSRRGSREVI